MSEQQVDHPYIDVERAFSSQDKRVISWEGSNYYRSCDAFVRKLPDGGSNYCIREMNHQDNNHIDATGHCTRDLTYIGDDVQDQCDTAFVPPEKGRPEKEDGSAEDVDCALEQFGDIRISLDVTCKDMEDVNNAMDILLDPLLTLARPEGRYAALTLYHHERDTTDPST